MCWLALFLACLFTGPASAQQLVEKTGPFQSDALRHPRARVPKRFGADLLAVPASVVGWDALDWTRFGAYGVLPLALMFPQDDHADGHVQRWIAEHRSTALDRALVKMETIPISVAIASYGALLFGTNLFFDDERVFEMGSLQLEALGVTQFFHITTKLLTGRESPYQGSGRFHGPTEVLFPGGTPSGHAASVYTILTVAAEYWDTWWGRLLAHAGGIYATTSLIYHDQHYLSDGIWGAAMGHFIGRFIVKHRSSHYRYADPALTLWDRTLFVPIVSSRGAALTASARF